MNTNLTSVDTVYPLDTTTDKPIRVLLWSAPGSGEHYSGPASFTYRLFANAPPGELEITLCHGVSEQKNYALFKDQVFLGDHQKSSWEQIKFIRNGLNWIDDHATEFDVMQSISGYQYSMTPSAHAEKLGLPAVIFVSNHLEQLGMSGGWRKYIRLHKKRQRMALEMTAFVAMSTAIREELLGYGVAEERIIDIPMGVNTNVFNPVSSLQYKQELRQEFQLQDMPTLLFVGTLVKRKRPHLLVKAVALLKKQGIDCQLIMCGPEKDAQYAEQMRALAEEESVSDRILWTGYCVDASPYYKVSDFYCLPSSNEGMAASLVEAMASAIVPIVTPISGSADLVSDGINGKHISADEYEIANALKAYINDPKLAKEHSMAALGLVKEKYTDKVVYQQYLKLYQRLANGMSARE